MPPLSAGRRQTTAAHDALPGTTGSYGSKNILPNTKLMKYEGLPCRCVELSPFLSVHLYLMGIRAGDL